MERIYLGGYKLDRERIEARADRWEKTEEHT